MSEENQLEQSITSFELDSWVYGRPLMSDVIDSMRYAMAEQSVNWRLIDTPVRDLVVEQMRSTVNRVIGDILTFNHPGGPLSTLDNLSRFAVRINFSTPQRTKPRNRAEDIEEFVKALETCSPWKMGYRMWAVWRGFGVEVMPAGPNWARFYEPVFAERWPTQAASGWTKTNPITGKVYRWPEPQRIEEVVPIPRPDWMGEPRWFDIVPTTCPSQRESISLVRSGATFPGYLSPHPILRGIGIQ